MYEQMILSKLLEIGSRVDCLFERDNMILEISSSVMYGKSASRWIYRNQIRVFSLGVKIAVLKQMGTSPSSVLRLNGVHRNPVLCGQMILRKLF